ncbi:DUF5681 domain-containing protein [Novosphingobium sp.]|uniref:DUF5681 domain-containing protein n=1 Tax=Novosphingobium sp. TaxID=1874826 RepID=UPI003BAA9AE3
MPIRPIVPQAPSGVDARTPVAAKPTASPSSPAARQRRRQDGEDYAPAVHAAASAAEPAYEVGYRKPPKQSQFKPGQSGNPRGRPKAAKGVKTITRELLLPKVSVRTAAGEVRMSRIQAVFHKLMEQALKGNARALNQLINLYASAVPDQPTRDSTDVPETLTATDEAMLAEYEAMILRKQGVRS